MLFQTSHFLWFFVVFYTLFLLVQQKVALRNLLLVLASYYFYSVWDWRFLFLLLFITALDFILGIAMEDSRSPSKKKLWLWLSICSNLGLLGFFKYYNFFVSNLSATGIELHTLEIVLPVGISFFTFESLSYIIDVYRGKLKALRRPLDYALFISFFPHLVAGPIIRPATFFPAIQRKSAITADEFWTGLYRFGSGVFKKVLISDQLASLGVDEVFRAPHLYSTLDLLLVAYGYAFQIYLDFSAYSDMAIGLSRMMGIELPENFNLPYVAKNMQDFWRRWHISLSTWLRDYLYISLGGSRSGQVRRYFNVFITMLLGGLWHGASWTFVLWGAFHGFFIVLSQWLSSQNPAPFLAQEAANPNVKRKPFTKKLVNFFKIFITFHIVVVGWILFRAESLPHFGIFMEQLLRPSLWQSSYHLPSFFIVFLALGAVISFSGFSKLRLSLRERFPRLNLPLKIAFVSSFVALILIFQNHFKPFIYFQF